MGSPDPRPAAVDWRGEQRHGVDELVDAIPPEYALVRDPAAAHRAKIPREAPVCEGADCAPPGAPE